MIIRNTENKSNPFLDKLKNEITYCDLQGLIFGVPKEKIEFSIVSKELLPLTGVEAVQLSDNENTEKSHRAFSDNDWKLKLNFCQSLNADLFLVTYSKNNFFIESIKKQDNGQFIFASQDKLNNDEFVNWWKTKKGTKQSKAMVEGRKEQRKTIFDNVLEPRVYWGGNIDGIMFDHDFNPIVLIENRLSGQETVHTYNPAKWFHGTRQKGGDYMTWLPLWYISKYLGVPLVLLTYSKYNPDKCGAAVIENMNKDGIFYEENPPHMNILDSPQKCATWLQNVAKK